MHEIKCPKEVDAYHKELLVKLTEAYEYAKEARKKSIDPSNEVEIKITKSMAERVEEIVGPKGISKFISTLEKEADRVTVAVEAVKAIVDKKFGDGTKEVLVKQAVKTGTAILTEGVLVAPTEGIPDVKIKKNLDGSEYLAIYYAGPIRSAGGTAAALTVLLGEIARQKLNIANYRPTDTVIERYVEEINLYESRVTHLQYKPPDEHIRVIVKNCPVCITGDPTEKIEISAYRDVEGIETNRVRGGVPLVICEGIALKAPKILKYAKKFGLSWDWLEQIIKIKKREDKIEIKPDATYLHGVVAGRPIFAHPSAKGGFRLRYGRSIGNGIMAKAIHPATMEILDKFLAIGTHMKIERPGKGCVVTAVEELDGPVVRLKNGNVVKLHTREEAINIAQDIDKILYLGDILSTVGDFIKSNHPLMPGAWCEERWKSILKEKGIRIKKINTPEEAFEFAEETNTPLHPKYTYHWSDITENELFKLIGILKNAEIEYKKKDGDTKIDNIIIKENIKEAKDILEKLLVEHEVNNKNEENKEEERQIIRLKSTEAYVILRTLGMIDKHGKIDKHRKKGDIKTTNNGIIENEKSEEGEEGIEIKIIGGEKERKDILSIINDMCGIEIKAKAPTYIGARMGRPEKAKERIMDGKPNVLFPTGTTDRDITKLYKNEKTKEMQSKGVSVELARFRCKNCGSIVPYKTCPFCYSKTKEEKVCLRCGTITNEEEHCNTKTVQYDRRKIDLIKMYEEAKNRVGNGEDIRGVKGLSNPTRIPERLEKGFIRSKHGVYVFKDGTSRFDATDVPLTHFIPKEVGLTVDDLKRLGYTKNADGEDIKSEEDIVPLRHQDIIVSERCAEYLVKVAKVIDDMLITLYEMSPYYNINNKKDLIGHLCIGLSPHTSAGVLCRIIGFTKANVMYAHPYFHAAKRRNCDGDEDTIILLLDVFLNFSRHYLSEKRGGTMDAPIVLTPIIDPAEIDDEAHCIELVTEYSEEFYKAADKYALPNEIDIKTVADVIGTPEQYAQLPLTIKHGTINNANTRTTYTVLNNIPEKVKAQIGLQAKIRAVDLNDSIERLITDHFIPDIYGNLRTFSRQEFRCTKCNAIYRRIPLIGKCTRCSGNLVLTINKGGIMKYLNVTKDLLEKYPISEYLKQRMELVEKEIEEIFTKEGEKQAGLLEYL